MEVLWVKLDMLGINWCMLRVLSNILCILVYTSSMLRYIESTLVYLGITLRVY